MPVYREKKKKWTKDGKSYAFRCYYTDIYGNRKQKESKLYKLKSEAKEAERKFLEEANKGTDNTINVDNITFMQVYKEWLLYKEAKIKSTTFYSVVKRCEHHIIPFFEKYKLFAIRINTINTWKEQLLNLNITTEHKNTMIRTLKEILIYARDNYNFDFKIVNTLQLYRIETIITEEDAKTNFWTYEEFKNFINVVDNKLYYVIFNFLYYTGVRTGEMLALTWEDIDFKNKRVRINKTFTSKVLDGVYKITTPKTNNSIRLVDIDENLLKKLIDYKNEEKKIYNFNEKMFVFGNVKYIPPTTLRRYLNKYIKLANVKKITLHGFRHSHVSLLINLGCDSRDVAERIGDTIRIVEKTYYHMFPIKKKAAVLLLNNIENKG